MGCRGSTNCAAESAGDAFLYAFDLPELDGEDLRCVALIERKARLARLLRRSKPASCSMNMSLLMGPPCLLTRVSLALRHRVEARPYAVSVRALLGLGQVQEPGSEGGTAGTQRELERGKGPRIRR